MSDYSQGPGWWQASDGKWYPPQEGAGAAPQAPPPYGQPYGAAPSQSKAQAALILGILSLFLNFCFVPGILAIVWGGREKDYDSKAKTGYILGIIGTALSLLGIVFYITILSAD